MRGQLALSPMAGTGKLSMAEWTSAILKGPCPKCPSAQVRGACSGVGCWGQLLGTVLRSSQVTAVLDSHVLGKGGRTRSTVPLLGLKNSDQAQVGSKERSFELDDRFKYCNGVHLNTILTTYLLSTYCVPRDWYYYTHLQRRGLTERG